jgi:hypothetical protein
MKVNVSLVASAIYALVVTAYAAPAGPPETAALSKRKSINHYPDLLTATLEEISAGLNKGHFTAVELTEAYIARITETQPILRSIIEVNPHALADAADADAVRNTGHHAKYSLLGIPIILKDNIATARPE